jgi:TRAP-type C4-dicarboxylate transport system substrate-binding protein
MCAFGGPGLDTLYVTSIRPEGIDLSDQPLAGGVFALQPGARACPSRQPTLIFRAFQTTNEEDHAIQDPPSPPSRHMAFGAMATEFRSSDVHNSDEYPTVAAVKFMSEQIKQASGGKHSIKVFNKGALGSEKETIDQTKIGALDFTRVNISPMNAICAKTQVPTMPFLFRSVEHMRHVLDGRSARRS